MLLLLLHLLLLLLLCLLSPSSHLRFPNLGLPIRPQLPQLHVLLPQRVQLLVSLFVSGVEPEGRRFEVAGVREPGLVLRLVGYADQEHDVGFDAGHELDVLFGVERLLLGSCRRRGC